MDLVIQLEGETRSLARLSKRAPTHNLVYPIIPMSLGTWPRGEGKELVNW